jgi:lactoylglutathione lyase
LSDSQLAAAPIEGFWEVGLSLCYEAAHYVVIAESALGENPAARNTTMFLAGNPGKNPSYNMNSLLILLTVIFFSFSQAMSQQPVLDHIAIYVTDLEKSSAFYRDVLGLDSLPEPFRDGKHAWFAIGQGKQLHIIEGATSRTDQPKRNHTCFRIASLQDFITRLTKAGVAYEDLQGTPGAITLRPDGIQQIYFRDPDGYWIEMNDAGKQYELI